MKASEIAKQFADQGFEGLEEIKIPVVMVGRMVSTSEFAATWTTFYDAYQDGDQVTFEIGDGVVWTCPADQEIEAR
jgi:hypothetical protein